MVPPCNGGQAFFHFESFSLWRGCKVTMRHILYFYLTTRMIPAPLLKPQATRSSFSGPRQSKAKYMCHRRIDEVLDNEINIFIAA